jgi:hypothetical protein
MGLFEKHKVTWNLSDCVRLELSNWIHTTTLAIHFGLTEMIPRSIEFILQHLETLDWKGLDDWTFLILLILRHGDISSIAKIVDLACLDSFELESMCKDLSLDQVKPSFCKYLLILHTLQTARGKKFLK